MGDVACCCYCSLPTRCYQLPPARHLATPAVLASSACYPCASTCDAFCRVRKYDSPAPCHLHLLDLSSRCMWQLLACGACGGKEEGVRLLQVVAAVATKKNLYATASHACWWHHSRWSACCVCAHAVLEPMQLRRGSLGLRFDAN